MVRPRQDNFNFYRIVDTFLPEIELAIDEYYDKIEEGDISLQILELLHPKIIESSYFLFKEGNYREAVLNSIIAVFDFIRAKTKINKDGQDLISKAFSLTDPYLVLSELETESGKNDQKGFIQLFQGAYLGIRNPKAHSLEERLDKKKAAQYLIFASLLARRVEEASVIKTE